jgi:DNA-binding MarR family transcriptional regulator
MKKMVKAKRSKSAASETQDESARRWPLDEAAGYLLRRAHSVFVAHWQLRFRGSEHPITPVQAGMLTAIGHYDDLNQTILARMMNVEGPTLLQSLDRLEEHGYIRRVRRKDDRRSYALHLTPRGREVLKAVLAFSPERDATLLAVLSAKERDTLLHLLSRVVAHGKTLTRERSEAQPKFAPRPAARKTKATV